jgi:high affinity Mn2+ porin
VTSLRVFGMILLAASSVYGQSDDSLSLFNHSSSSRVFVAGQVNLIHQQHPEFFAKYTGENSLRPEREKATSSVMTLYTGGQITKSTDILFDVESAGGRGLSDALGLAGFTNVDVVRNPTLGSKPYLARLLFHQIISLGGEKIRVDRNLCRQI